MRILLLSMGTRATMADQVATVTRLREAGASVDLVCRRAPTEVLEPILDEVVLLPRRWKWVRRLRRLRTRALVKAGLEPVEALAPPDPIPADPPPVDMTPLEPAGAVGPSEPDPSTVDPVATSAATSAAASGPAAPDAAAPEPSPSWRVWVMRLNPFRLVPLRLAGAARMAADPSARRLVKAADTIVAVDASAILAAWLVARYRRNVRVVYGTTALLTSLRSAAGARAGVTGRPPSPAEPVSSTATTGGAREPASGQVRDS